MGERLGFKNLRLNREIKILNRKIKIKFQD